MISIDMGRVHIEVHQGEISNFPSSKSEKLAASPKKLRQVCFK
jgi:hypothetical protein